MASSRTICVFLATFFLVVPAVSFGDPPTHAPAHGRRAKEKEKEHHAEKHREPAGGVEVVFDSERGLHVAIGLPGIYLHGGTFYRHTDAGWQVSSTGKGGWSVVARSSVPEKVGKTHPGPPAKAWGHQSGKHRKGKRRK